MTDRQVDGELSGGCVSLSARDCSMWYRAVQCTQRHAEQKAIAGSMLFMDASKRRAMNVFIYDSFKGFYRCFHSLGEIIRLKCTNVCCFAWHPHEYTSRQHFYE
jgi:hypothetical protein